MSRETSTVDNRHKTPNHTELLPNPYHFSQGFRCPFGPSASSLRRTLEPFRAKPSVFNPEEEATLKRLNLTRTTDRKAFWGRLTSRIREKAGELCRGGHGRLLDVGCGNGLFFASLNGVDDLHLVGLDRSRDLLSEAREANEEVKLVQGLLEVLPLRDASFDWVVCLSTLYNLPGMDEVAHALREMMRICKPGGRGIVDVRNGANPYIRLKYWWHRIWSDFPVKAYPLSQFVYVFEKEGFEIERIVSIGPSHSRLALAYLIQARRMILSTPKASP